MSAAIAVITTFGPKVPVVMPVRPRPLARGRASVLSAVSGRMPGRAVAGLCQPAERQQEARNREMTVSEQDKAQAVERAARLLGSSDQASWQALESLWDEAYDQGRLDALDELQDRFCVCMK
jgi:hypothetical protein